ncbi:MAG: hypothetical protein A2042_04295 [Candidatus Schekmanbacteria bacterium GWA2_38_11]|uniref:Desulfoferrodoxin N-terminal domain-containing protein n=1 Tax=Candidatus Schekmanbacteria bacterium GWA2_38_11 TaxID=1817876 RepID=A0A1F7RE50_9BACT|nr:MAG: hypothetical protein A2042_04295 [Candidatus Schekmanbacteria bacterium GWA2_38_11]
MVDWLGKTLFCQICGKEIKVIRPPGPSWGSGPSVMCCREEMIVKTYASQKTGQEKEEVVNENGKYYTCLVCGREIEIKKGGKGTVYCCGQPMVLKQ